MSAGLMGDQLGFGGFAGVPCGFGVCATAGATEIDIKGLPAGAVLGGIRVGWLRELGLVAGSEVSAWWVARSGDQAREVGGGVRARRGAEVVNGFGSENLNRNRAASKRGKSSTKVLVASAGADLKICGPKRAGSATNGGSENLARKKGAGRGLMAAGCPESQNAKKARSVETVRAVGVKRAVSQKKFAGVNQGTAGGGVGQSISKNLAGGGCGLIHGLGMAGTCSPLSVKQKTKRKEN